MMMRDASRLLIVGLMLGVELASGDAAAITGTDLVVDGGTMANAYVVETLPQ